MRMLVCPPAALLITAAVVPVAQAADAIPTFSKDVAPIIYQHCVQCHRPNTTAPMSLIQYKDVRPGARAILQE